MATREARSVLKLRLALVTVLIGTAVRAAPEGMTNPRYRATDWVAIVGEWGGFKPFEWAALDPTPEVIVFRDGRIVWREERRESRVGGMPSVEWLQGRVDRRAWRRVLRVVQRTRFLTARPEKLPEGFPETHDATTTDVGICLKRCRMVSAYAPDLYLSLWDSRNPHGREIAQGHRKPGFLVRVVAVRDAIMALRPRVSSLYRPDRIRVSLVQARSTNNDQPWPLAARPLVMHSTWGPHNYFTGADAETVRAALEKGLPLRIGDTSVVGIWTPAIDLPPADLTWSPWEKELRR
jgi:hypothetical protein